MLHHCRFHRERDSLRVKQGAQLLRSDRGADDFARDRRECGDPHDVIDVVKVILSVSMLTQQDMQVTKEHQGGSVRKLALDMKTEGPNMKRLGLMALAYTSCP